MYISFLGGNTWTYDTKATNHPTSTPYPWCANLFSQGGRMVLEGLSAPPSFHLLRSLCHWDLLLHFNDKVSEPFTPHPPLLSLILWSPRAKSLLPSHHPPSQLASLQLSIWVAPDDAVVSPPSHPTKDYKCDHKIKWTWWWDLEFGFRVGGFILRVFSLP